MRNRASAQLSRERKKAHMKKLELQLREMTAMNQKLTAQVSTLTMVRSLLPVLLLAGCVLTCFVCLAGKQHAEAARAEPG